MQARWVCAGKVAHGNAGGWDCSAARPAAPTLLSLAKEKPSPSTDGPLIGEGDEFHGVPEASHAFEQMAFLPLLASAMEVALDFPQKNSLEIALRDR
jgi:hypothetical protein